jgi:hypothetical protein
MVQCHAQLGDISDIEGRAGKIYLARWLGVARGFEHTFGRDVSVPGERNLR